MRKLRYHLVNVFTDDAPGGQALAVFTDANTLSSATMQAIAKYLNFPMTAFVLPPADSRNDYRVCSFAPASELPMANAAIIGTTFVLLLEQMMDARNTIRLETGAGVVFVTIQWRGEAPAEIQIRDAGEAAILRGQSSLVGEGFLYTEETDVFTKQR